MSTVQRPGEPRLADFYLCQAEHLAGLALRARPDWMSEQQAMLLITWATHNRLGALRGLGVDTTCLVARLLRERR
ncbi:MAG: hypothetical protein HY329_05350 [Chloroflexi bacterium]|nr:hypothetical protein [Chloroflexota bacterium]